MSIDSIQGGSHVSSLSIDHSHSRVNNRLFSDLDIDNDGFLSTDEVMNGNRFHDDKDIDKDGIITLREVLSYLQDKTDGHSAQLLNTMPQSVAEHLASIQKEARLETNQLSTSTQTTSHDVNLDQDNVSQLLNNMSHDNDLSVTA